MCEGGGGGEGEEFEKAGEGGKSVHDKALVYRIFVLVYHARGTVH